MIFPEFRLVDFLLCTILLTSGIYGVYFFRRKYNITSPFLIPLFYAKLLGLLIFLVLNIGYSNIGDTFKYYNASKYLYQIFLTSPWSYLEVIFSDNDYVHHLLFNIYPDNAFRGDFSFLSMVKVVSIFNTMCMNSFWAVSILFCFLSFIGSWLMYVGFEKFGNFNAFQSVLILFFPSVLFWASGIMKDSLCYFLLGVLFYLLTDENQFASVQFKWIKRGVFLISLYLLFLVKWYILFAFLGAYFLMLIVLLILKKNSIWQTVLFIGFSLLIISFISYENLSGGLFINKVVSRIKDFHNWHFLVSNSKYSFEEMDYDLMTLIWYFPEAVFTTLFRPFLWEINNLFLLIPAIESLFLLTLLILVVVKFRWNGIRNVLINPYIIWMLFFFLLLSYITGISSYSFGALSRYRIPSIPFYLVFIFKLLESLKQRVKSI